jgi:hypothetical protein
MRILKKSVTPVAIATIAFLGTTIAWSEQSQAASLRSEQIKVAESSEGSLQEIVDGMMTSGSSFDTASTPLDTFNVNEDQLDLQTLEVPTGDLSITFKILEEKAGYKNTNSFGLFDGANYVKIFDGKDSAGASVTLNIWADGTYSFGGEDTRTAFQGENIGFYLKNYQTLYSEDSRNISKGKVPATQALMYQGSDGQQLTFGKNNTASFDSDDVLIAWEDKPFWGTDKDFNDFLLVAENLLAQPELEEEITEVPEPSAIASLSLVIGSLVAYRRRLNQSRQS